MNDKPRWRSEARQVIRRYPELLKKEAQIRTISITPNYSGMPSAHTASRTTENQALLTLPHDEQRDLDAVRTALDTIRRYRNGDLRYKLVDIVYWKRSHTVDGAAMLLHVHEKTAHEWDRGFIELVDSYRRIF